MPCPCARFSVLRVANGNEERSPPDDLERDDGIRLRCLTPAHERLKENGLADPAAGDKGFEDEGCGVLALKKKALWPGRYTKEYDVNFHSYVPEPNCFYYSTYEGPRLATLEEIAFFAPDFSVIETHKNFNPGIGRGKGRRINSSRKVIASRLKGEVLYFGSLAKI